MTLLTIVTFLFGYHWKYMNVDGYNFLNFIYLYYLARYLKLQKEKTYAKYLFKNGLSIWIGCSILLGALIGNERLHYIEPHHGVSVLDRLWEIGTAVREQKVMEIVYEKLKGHETVHRTVEPVGIMFSEYYFYLTAFIRDIDREKEFENKDDLFPTIYRLDRIKSYRITNEHFQVRYAERFEEGEFRKRVQFMYGGKLQTIKFRYTGPSLEAVLDRLPTARAEENPDGGWDVTAEVFGKGAEMWAKGQQIMDYQSE